MSLLDKASLVMTPNAVKATKVYSVIPSNGNGDMTFTRGTPASATRTNSSGVIENVAIDVPRLNYDTVGGCPSLLLEPQRTNRLLNSDIVVTQTIATTGVACAVSFYGTGTITFSGTFVGSLVGTGVNNRVSIVFTPTTGNLILTVSGSCTKGQLETGSYPTTYIPTTTGTVTRVADACIKTGISDLIGQTEGVLFVESAALFNDSNIRILSISDETVNNRIQIQYIATSNGILFAIKSNGGTTQLFLTSSFITTNFNKIAIRYKINDITFWINGSKIHTLPLAQSIPLNLSKLSFDGINDSIFYSKVKQLQLYKTYLTDTEMANLTTI